MPKVKSKNKPHPDADKLQTLFLFIVLFPTDSPHFAVRRIKVKFKLLETFIVSLEQLDLLLLFVSATRCTDAEGHHAAYTADRLGGVSAFQKFSPENSPVPQTSFMLFRCNSATGVRQTEGPLPGAGEW